ncbi:MAG TPA: UPF0182 family protein [Acidimicrobiia bacterium]|nr:UPF0182 family protein [Acidimicrobiia bacterium]
MFTRAPADYSADRRRPLTIIVVVVAVVYLVLTALGTLWTDYLWFDSIGYSSVWQRKWGMSILLGAVGTAVAFFIFWLSLRLVDRFSPRWAPFELSEEEELIERFREWMEPRVRLVRFWVTSFLALLLGVTVASWRDEVFLFMNHKEFGITDPIFGLDVGFYVFRLPMWASITDWLFNALVLATLVVVVSHYFNGGIRFNGRRFTIARGPKTHISIMLALIALVRAAVYRLDMFELMLSDRGSTFFGPGYTDVTARLPAYRLLILVALVAAVLFIVNIFRQGWTLALVAVGSWLVVAVAAAAVYPAIVERFQVAPRPLVKETEYLQSNLAFTRAAWGLDQVKVQPFAASADITAEDLDANQLTVDNLRIWTPSVLPRTYQNFQELRTYYNLGVVDTDRYINEGAPTQVMLAVRELEELNLPRDDWQNQRLIYTHGVGAVANAAAIVEEDGQPRFLLQDVPPLASVPQLELEQPRVYFGETYQAGRPVIVGTGDEPQEIDYPLQGEGTEFNRYDGDAGVSLGSIWQRIAFAFRYRDLNLLISGEIRPESKVLVERNIRQIVEDIAPFLHVDTDPYPVIMDGRILWVLDLYTTSDHYPYSQPITRTAHDRLARSSSLQPGINYMRNSVKAVVDAYDGDVTFYLNDPADPIALAWSEAFPGLLRPASEMPAGLVDHLRYPQDLFRIQGQLYLEYHVTDYTELFSGNDAWSLPADPSTISRGSNGGSELLGGDEADATTGAPLSYRAEILPYYLLTSLPNEADLSYLLLQPFTPKDKKNMASFLVADSTPGRYGRLIDFRMPQGELVDGTEQVAQRIEQDADISQQFTLWDSTGSKVIKGDMLLVPVEDSLLYIQPIFLEGEEGGFPEFRRVIVVYGDQVEWAETLDGALGLVFGGEGGAPVPPTGSDGTTVEQLLGQAAAAFDKADDALGAGDLSEYQRWVDEAHRLLEEARSALQGAAEASRDRAAQ